ncbi:hypothetical protein CORC01_04761 [Colletotrichum orchidophilum]|uniref:Fructose-bisphosphate aldolase n=1 Tax=Colletotrichum orchidophilum TaxID=1209926 RepID=A0A1G4BER7_9PEZI|nr:uncharacterized protein CORC01_04761 [Colletotrichum orchidophilum]OHE99860.1 hypothetical protein CORC01_04761 [Colletotrichum orchidophilum]
MASWTRPDWTSKTMIEEVDEFIATGVNSPAPAFGNLHDEYGKLGTQLNFERLEKIRAQIAGKVWKALHGTNGFPPDLMKQCIAAGATKIKHQQAGAGRLLRPSQVPAHAIPAHYAYRGGHEQGYPADEGMNGDLWTSRPGVIEWLLGVGSFPSELQLLAERLDRPARSNVPGL